MTPAKSLLVRLPRAANSAALAVLFVLSAAGIGAAAQARPGAPATARTSDAYRNLPLQFEPNQGQIDASVKYVSRGQGYSIFLQPTAATFALHKPEPKTEPGKMSSLKPIEGEVFRMGLVGANTKATMSAEHPLQGYVNYMLGNDRSKWHEGVPTYGQTRVAAAYPGVDLVYYGTQRQLEYDFVVAPGAKTENIRFVLDGAKAVVSADGELVLQVGKKNSDDDLRFQKPVLYQQQGSKRQPVEGSFTVAANGEVGFQVGKYDHSRELVIDPILSYASYFGGSGNDYIYGEALNAANQLYVVGQTTSLNLLATTGEYQSIPHASSTGFISKISADGSAVLWTTYLGGQQTGNDYVNAIAVSSSDQAYVTGYTTSEGTNGSNVPGQPGWQTAFPITTDALQVLCGGMGDDGGVVGGPYLAEISNCAGAPGTPDAFISRLSSDGKTLIYSTFLGGTQNDVGFAIGLDAKNNIYVAGITESTGYDFSNVQSCAKPAYPVNSSGTPDLGYADFPTTNGLAYEPSYYLASTKAPPGKDNNCQNEVLATDLPFLSVLAADGHSMLYSTTFGGLNLGNCGNGPCDTYVYAMAVTPAGIAYVGGATSSSTWSGAAAGQFASSCPAHVNGVCPQTGWLSVFDPTKIQGASLIFSTYLTGSSGGTDSNGNNILPSSQVYGLTTDSAGNVYATGNTTANNFPTTTGVLQPGCAIPYGDGNGNINPCNSAFVTKLSPTGATIWSTYYRGTRLGSNGTTGNGVAVDAKGDVFVVGTSAEPTIPVVKSLATPYNNFSDAFLIELSPDASTLLMGTFLGATNGIAVNNNSLQLDSNLNAYFSGWQQYVTNGGQTFPATSNAFSPTGLGGSTDAFVVKMITQQQTSATGLTVSPNPATPSQTVTLTATVTTPSTITGTILPTGVVTFYNGPTVIGTGTLNVSGVATFTGTLATATYNVTANYPGDAGFNSSVSTETSLTVSSAVNTTTALTVVPANAAFGVGSVLTATVVAGTAPATAGTVSFAAGSVSLGTATVNAQGVATVTAKPNFGLYSVIASYAGTYAATTNPTGYAPSASAGVALTVTKATTTTVLTSSTASAGAATSFMLTASVPAGATGTVTFFNGATSLGTGSVGTNGTATLATSITAAGSYSLTATYGGDTNYSGSTSAVLTQVIVVPGFAVTANPSSLTITRGSTGTTTLTLTPAGGYTGVITLSCGTLPSNATCSFSPMSVTLASAATTEVLTIGTGSATAMLSAPHVSGRYDLIFSALTLWLPGSLLGLFGLAKRKKLSGDMRRLTLLAALCFLGMGAISGCGGSPSNAGANETPAGSYTVSVTVAGPTGSPQSLNLTVVVQ